MKKPIPPLDIEAIRIRLAASNPFGVPRWVASDVGHLLAEVAKLRAEAREREASMQQALAEAVSKQSLSDEDAAYMASLEAENADLRAKLAQSRAWHAEIAPLVVELTADKMRIIGWLRGFASTPSRGPVSPVRRTEQLFAAHVAGVIERGEHLTPAGGEA